MLTSRFALCPAPRVWSRNFAGAIAAGIVALGSGVSSAQEIPQQSPTAQDMYVACYLFTRKTDVPLRDDGKSETFGTAYCGVAAMSAMANLEGRQDRELSFCLPTSSQARSDPGTLMAHAYLDWFERRATNLSGLSPQDNNGVQAFAVAMLEQFPCA